VEDLVIPIPKSINVQRLARVWRFWVPDSIRGQATCSVQIQGGFGVLVVVVDKQAENQATKSVSLPGQPGWTGQPGAGGGVAGFGGGQLGQFGNLGGQFGSRVAIKVPFWCV